MPYSEKSAAYMGIAAPLVFAVAAVATAYLRSDYSHTTSFVSELGETGGAFAWLMSWFGFGLMALGTLLFALHFLFTDLPVSVRVGLGMVCIFACGLFGAGWYSCDPGCTPEKPSFEQVMHDISSLCLVWLSLTCFYVAALRWARWRFAIYSLATGLFFLACSLLLFESIATRDLTGVYQRLGIAALWLWLMVLALKLKSSVIGSGSVGKPAHI